MTWAAVAVLAVACAQDTGALGESALESSPVADSPVGPTQHELAPLMDVSPMPAPSADELEARVDEQIQRVQALVRALEQLDAGAPAEAEGRPQARDDAEQDDDPT